MHPHLTIELPDETLAEELRRHLQSFDVDALEVDAHWELRIHLFERNPESRVTNALHAIDSWLPTAGVESVRVRLDGSTYTLHAPPTPTASWRAADPATASDARGDRVVAVSAPRPRRERGSRSAGTSRSG